MNILKTTFCLIFTFLLALPAETFAQSAGGQISRKPKTAVKKESPAKKKSPSKSTAKKTPKSNKPTAKRETCSPTPTAVDLGLPSGTLWADRNIGANCPEGYGDYFAWGETSPKSVYDWSTYKYSNGNSSPLTKYCYDSSCGTVDNKRMLEASDDAATANWSYKWRMPTHEEETELREKCTWKWTTRNSVKGYKVIGPNGNSIFLPAAGSRNDNRVLGVGSSGYYWSASLCESGPKHAWGIGFFSYGHNNYSSFYRYEGRKVRAVAK